MGKKDTKKTMANTVSVQPQNPLKKYYVIFGLLAFFLFANTLGNGYNMDDSMVTNNHKLTSKGLSAIGEIFTSPYYSDDAGYAYGYRPMVHLSFALEQELFGQKPGAGHFINVLLFVISVILFFKLLVKWVGEKNILFAAVATLLFTVHPIHTEVVASLKNRDELLAFLFVIWAGVCAFKYLEKEKISSLIAVFLLFSLAMLSKKSVYPMAIILPVSMVLLHTVPLKKNSAIALAMVLPAAIIGSDLLVERMFIMFALALAAIGSATYVKYQFLTPNNSDTTKKQAWILPVILLFIVVMASFYFSSLYLSVLAIPLFVWLLYLHFNTGLLSIILYSTALFFLFNRTAFIALPIMLALGYGVYLWKNKQSYAYWLIGALVLIIAMQFLQFNPLFLLNFLAVVVFIGLLISNILYGIGYLLLVVAGYFYFDSLFNPFLISLISILILWFIYQKTTSKNWIVLIPVVFFSIIFSQNAYQQFLFDSSNQPIAQTVQLSNDNRPTSDKKTIKEGRELLYVENTLVAPHSKSETIATGLAVLGEYAYLHFVPVNLSFYYGFAKIKTENFGNVAVWLSLLFHLLLIGVSIWQIKKRPLISIGIMWYLLSILLFSNWVELVAGMVGERLAFTASAGFCIAITAVIFWISPQFSIKKPGVVGAVFGLVCILFAGRTIARNADWKDEMTLMSHDIKHLGNAAQVNNLYAMTLMRNSFQNSSLTAQQKLEMQKEAIGYFDTTTELWPEFYNAYIDKARATMVTGDFDKGIAALHKAIEIQPDNELSYYLLLDVCEKKADWNAYLKSAQQFFELVQNENTYGYVARGYFMLKDYTKSKELLLEGLQKFPTSEMLKGNLKVLEGR